jgi:hypothetical protein
VASGGARSIDPLFALPASSDVGKLAPVRIEPDGWRHPPAPTASEGLACWAGCAKSAPPRLLGVTSSRPTHCAVAVRSVIDDDILGYDEEQHLHRLVDILGTPVQAMQNKNEQ